jgi:hypothetical protein
MRAPHAIKHGTPRLRALLNETPLELSEGREDVKDEFTQGVVVSMAPSQTDRKPTLNSLSGSIKVTKWRTERPSRSNRQTSSASAGRSCLKHASNPARSYDAPDAVSVKISFFVDATFLQSVELKIEVLVARTRTSVSDKTSVGSRWNHNTDSAADPCCASLWTRQAGPDGAPSGPDPTARRPGALW